MTEEPGTTCPPVDAREKYLHTQHASLPPGHSLNDCLRAAFYPDEVDANYLAHTAAQRYDTGTGAVLRIDDQAAAEIPAEGGHGD